MASVPGVDKSGPYILPFKIFFHRFSPPESRRRLQVIRKGWQEFFRYLIYLQVPLLFLLLAQVAFLSEQVHDVLLGMAFEPHWSAFGLAAAAAALFGIALWFAARALSELRWMTPSPLAQVAPGLSQEAKPRVCFLPAWVGWWLPRFLGIAPPLRMALALARGCSCLRRSLCLHFFYLRIRLANTITLHIRLLNRLVEALTISSGNRDGLFTPRAALVLLAQGWIILDSFSLPLAVPAYGTYLSSFANNASIPDR